ncbi:hypothetical protein Efla_006872 [Eimeria flavescens]
MSFFWVTTNVGPFVYALCAGCDTEAGAYVARGLQTDADDWEEVCSCLNCCKPTFSASLAIATKRSKTRCKCNILERVDDATLQAYKGMVQKLVFQQMRFWQATSRVHRRCSDLGTSATLVGKTLELHLRIFLKNVCL